MTVQNTANFVDFVGDDVTTSFPFTFRADDVSWLTVDFTDNFDQFTLNVDQINNPGGTVEYTVAPPSPGMGGPDPSFRVTRVVPANQLLAYTRYDPFDSASHESALDKLTMIVQDQVTVIAVQGQNLQDQITTNNLLITTGVSPGHQHVEADIIDLGNYTNASADEDISGFWEFINVAGMAVYDAGKNSGGQFRVATGYLEMNPVGLTPVDGFRVQDRLQIVQLGIPANSLTVQHDGTNVVFTGANVVDIDFAGISGRLTQGGETFAYLSDIAAAGLLPPGLVLGDMIRWDGSAYELAFGVRATATSGPPAPGTGYLEFLTTGTVDETRPQILFNNQNTACTQYFVPINGADDGFYLRSSNSGTHTWGARLSTVDSDVFRMTEDGELIVLATGAGFYLQQKAAGPDTAGRGQIYYSAGGGGDPQWAEVEMLADFDGADAATSYTEISTNAANASFFGNAQLDTAQFNSGSASLLLDGTGDYVTFPDIAAYDLGTSDWTVEGFVRFNTLPPLQTSLGPGYVQFEMRNGGGELLTYAIIQDGFGFRVRLSGDGFAEVGTISGGISTGVWYHWAMTRTGGNIRAYFNGNYEVGDFGAAAADMGGPTLPIAIGRSEDGADAEHDGWIDDIRFTVGTARYTGTGTYTIPTTPYPGAPGAPSLIFRDEVGAETDLLAGGGGGEVIPAGTVSSSLLRWDGAAWVEMTDTRISALGQITTEQGMSFSDGTDFVSASVVSNTVVWAESGGWGLMDFGGIDTRFQEILCLQFASSGSGPFVPTNYGAFFTRDNNPTRPMFKDDGSQLYELQRVQPLSFVNANQDMNTGETASNLIGDLLIYTDGANYTVTLEDSGSTDFRIKSSFDIIVPGSGTITVNEGSGDTLFFLDGPGGQVIDTAGGCTIDVGGVATVYRRTATEWYIWGSNITP